MRKATKSKSKYPTYATRDEALLAMFKETNWDPGIYLSIFPTDDGRYYYTLDESESFAIADKLAEKRIKYYRVIDDGSDERFTKRLDDWYEREVRREFEKIVPRRHPQYKALWEHHFGDLSGCANGLGGYGAADGAVESHVGWIPNSKRIWVEEITNAVNRLHSGEKAKKLIMTWTKGKTPRECASVTAKEWAGYELYTECDFREFARSWAEQKLASV
jgi:hypothetical protein